MGYIIYTFRDDPDIPLILQMIPTIDESPLRYKVEFEGLWTSVGRGNMAFGPQWEGVKYPEWPPTRVEPIFGPAHWALNGLASPSPDDRFIIYDWVWSTVRSLDGVPMTVRVTDTTPDERYGGSRIVEEGVTVSTLGDRPTSGGILGNPLVLIGGGILVAATISKRKLLRRR